MNRMWNAIGHEGDGREDACPVCSEEYDERTLTRRNKGQEIRMRSLNINEPALPMVASRVLPLPADCARRCSHFPAALPARTAGRCEARGPTGSQPVTVVTLPAPLMRQEAAVIPGHPSVGTCTAALNDDGRDLGQCAGERDESPRMDNGIDCEARRWQGFSDQVEREKEQLAELAGHCGVEQNSKTGPINSPTEISRP